MNTDTEDSCSNDEVRSLNDSSLSDEIFAPDENSDQDNNDSLISTDKKILKENQCEMRARRLRERTKQREERAIQREVKGIKRKVVKIKKRLTGRGMKKEKVFRQLPVNPLWRTTTSIKNKQQSSDSVKYCKKMSKEFKNGFQGSLHNIDLKGISEKCHQLEDLIPPSVQKKNIMLNVRLPEDCLEASMVLPTEEDSKVNTGFGDTSFEGQHADWLVGDSCWNNNALLHDTFQSAASVQSACPGRLVDHVRTLATDTADIALPSLPPKPPSVRNPRELYTIVNLQNEDRLPWEKLSKVNKTQYYKALGILKKDYIRKYKSYLHTLSSEQLHNHRMEIMSSQINT